MVSIYSNQVIANFTNTFKLERGKDVRQYFPADKYNPREVIATKLKRFAHFITTGVTINEQRICNWVDCQKDKSVSSLFRGKAIERKVIRHQHGMNVAKPSFLSRLKTALRFLTEFIRAPNTVGAILPSSKYLAKEIVKEIPKDLHAPKRLILEVGPGTGIFSDKIIKRMNPADELHLVEYDKDFADLLADRYKNIANVKVFHKSILEHEAGEKYDYVISGLPLNGFTADFVREVFKKFTELAREKTRVSYFEYLFIPKIKAIFCSAQERKNLEEVLSIKQAFHARHMKGEGHVFLNAPCARVLHHEIKAG